jgi:pimeloyl-ACP methyl ester carboxylesterase
MGGLVSALAFPVPSRTYSEPSLKHEGDRLVWLTTDDDASSRLKVPALYLQRQQYKTPITILYSHGNAEDIGINIPYLEHLSEVLNVNVLAYEYPGYSIADGDEPSEELCCAAIRAAYHYLVDTQKVDPSTIVLMGRSLGTGPTVDLASKTPEIAGTILQSPLESGIRCVLGTCSSVVLYPFDIFRSYAKIQNIVGPVFIVHGLADRVVPCQNGKALQALLEQRPQHQEVAYDPVWIPGRGHNDMPHEYCLELFQKFLLYLPKYQRKLMSQRAVYIPQGTTCSSEQVRKVQELQKQKDESEVFQSPSRLKAEPLITKITQIV